MRIPLVTFFLVCTLIPAAGQMHDGCLLEHPGSVSYKNPLYEKWLSAYDVISYNIFLSVSNRDTRIDGSAALLIAAERDLDTIVLELQEALNVSKIQFSDDIGRWSFADSDTLSFEKKGDAVYIAMDRPRMADDKFRLKIFYGGDAGQNRGFFAGITSSKDHGYGFDVTYTLSEPHNSKDWLPVKQVLEDKIDSVTFRLRCHKDLLAGSNGLLVDVEEDGEDHILTWRTRYPMAYYLLSFAVADYRDFSFYTPLSGDGDSVLVQNYIYDDKEVFSDWEDEIRATGSMITTFSKLLVDYPFALEKYGHCMAPMGGGMEHQTMTTLQDFSFYLVSHELAHQWFGDFVTCGNWQDIWINEGFASYFEYVAAQQLLGQEAADGWMDNAMSIALRETDGSVYVPEELVEDTYRLFDYGLSYKKGAILLHMIRFILNDDSLFFGLIREDFREILESGSGRDFSCFFDQWYYGEGFPRFTVYWDQEGDTLRIQSEQTASASGVTPFFRVPFEIEVRMAGVPSERIRMEQTSGVQDFSLAVDGLVEDVVFDPGNNLLKTVSVIHQVPADRTYRIGPNPVSGELYIQVPNTGSIEKIRITNLSGQEILEWSDAGNPVTMDLSFLSDGSYLLEFSGSSGKYQERIVKITTK
jgi:aminopeptidase N